MAIVGSRRFQAIKFSTLPLLPVVDAESGLLPKLDRSALVQPDSATVLRGSGLTMLADPDSPVCAAAGAAERPPESSWFQF
jgi:hypothetical protein